MATTDKDYTITGTTPATSYSFDFPYMKAKDVQVELNGIRLIPIEEEDLNSNPPKPHKFTRQTTQITLVDTPTSGNKLRIYRETDDSGLTSTFYPGSAIRSNDLNDNFTQNLYSTQENTKDADLALDNSRRWDETLDNGNGDWKSAFDKSADAVATADLAEDKADTAKLSTDSLVATNSGTAQNPVWVLQGDGNNTTQNNKGVAYAVSTADTAKDAADITTLATDNLVATNSGTEANPIWVLQGDGSNSTTNNKGVKYAVEKVDDWIVNGDGLGANEEGVPYAVAQAVAAVASATNANNTANAADEIADEAKLATDRLIGTTSNNGSTWTVTGYNTNASTDPKGLGYAITTADDAADDATIAKTDAASAVTSAGNAVTTADAAEDAIEKYVADSNGLKGAGTTHGQTPDTDPRGVAYAVATAESAANSVAQSAIYTVVANFAALPALTDASLSAEGASPYYQITDSTLIQNESTVTGEPANFTGDDELAVKLKANITASPKVWEWQEYYATDPETRYRKKLIVESLATISEDYTIGIGNNGLSVGTVTISSANTVTIPENSRYVVL